ncbi:MAG: SxtJ family membrane protein [bacterium]
MKTPPTAKELRNFGLSLGVVCLIWAGVLTWRGHPEPVKWLLGAAPVLAALGLTWPAALGPLHRVWMPVAHGIAQALTWVLLAVVFYVVFTPYGLISRALGKDPLDRKIDRNRASYWIRREDGPFDPERLKRQY